MHGIRTRGRRMVGTDKTTELWRPSNLIIVIVITDLFFVLFKLLT